MSEDLQREYFKLLVRFIDAARDGKAQQFFVEHRAELWGAEASMRATLKGDWNRGNWDEPEAG